MDVTSVSALSNSMERFDKTALRAVSSAQNISNSSPTESNLTTSFVDLAVSEQVVKATSAAVSTENQLKGDTLNIIA